MINAMTDDEFWKYMFYISSLDAMSNDNCKEIWAEEEGWEDEAAKFYGYDNKDKQFNDENLLL